MTNPLPIPTPDREGGSPFGSSFIKGWWECPKKWWYGFLAPHPKGGLGLESQFLAKPLAIGIVVHKWLEVFYITGNAEAADQAVTNWFKDYQGPEIMDLGDVDDMVTTLVSNYLDYERTNPLVPLSLENGPLLECNLAINLGYNGYIYTARLDGVVTNTEDGYNYILENKTVDVSRYQELVGSVDFDIQFTGQNFLAHHLLPTLNIQGVLVNILKKRVGKNNSEKIDRRISYPNPQKLEKFRLDITRTLENIDQSIAEYDELVSLAMPPYEAARQVYDERGDRKCNWCEFKEICRNPTKAEAFASPFLARASKGFLKEYEG